MRLAAAQRLALVACACAVAAASCGPRHPAPRATATLAAVAVNAKLELVPLDVSPDGEARLLVRLHYTDAAGGRAHIPPGGHVDVTPSRGEVQWQPRVRYGDPAAIVRLTEAGPVALRVTSDVPHVPRTLTAATDTRAWRLAPVAVRALGPHVVAIGWFPRVDAGTVRIERTAGDGSRIAFAVAAPASSFRDTTVAPGAHYAYSVTRPDTAAMHVRAAVPAQFPSASSDVLRGKAMWLAFDDVSHWNVDAMLDRAQSAGISAVELRLCYGEYSELNPANRPTIDRFIDGAAARHIAILAWTVPRAVSFEDLAANLASLAYRTPAGTPLAGIAVDLERGSEFLGTGQAGRAALGTYLGRLREAVGAGVLIVATVEDPQLESLTNEDVPYTEIATDADVLQPMVYWRARRNGTSIDGMRAQLQASYATLRRIVGTSIPIDIGGQTADLGYRLGAPPPAEVAASLGVAAQLGAIGEAFFDWDATTKAQWAAIAATPFAPSQPVPAPFPENERVPRPSAR